ncbi:MAG: response regulator [Cyclobacteriaceae bacterium]|nr:response regulator [Cyclobacteriaceae bacterium]
MKKKILIIDDEVDFGLLMMSFFNQKDFDVFVAHTIADGLQVLEAQKPDFVFLDNNLPDGLGWGKTEFILLNYPNTRLNLISALDVPKTSASNFHILYKPAMREELARIFG